ncbi:MAG: cadmium-translocating P-type ATPase [Clostridia bacterium]|nr:cadmium-translocating P-type ATPase [Clostridia bacterium]
MKLNLNKKDKRFLIRLLFALFLFTLTFTLDKIFTLSSLFDKNLGWLFTLAVYLSIYIFIGYDVLIKAIKNIINLQPFSEHFLMMIATLGAFALGVYRAIGGLSVEGFDEACAVLLFYQAGELFQRLATNNARNSISKLMDIMPDNANLVTQNKVISVDPYEVEIGSTLVVYSGEKIAIDGVVIDGNSLIDNRALTGESMPVEVGEGSTVLSGSINLTSEIKIKTTKSFECSTASKILELVENASDKKSKTENFISRFAKYYTPTVVICALLLAIVPPIFTGDHATWIYRALNFLVVSCPCALVISVPLTFFVALGNASSKGILVKGSSYLELLSKANIFIFDKTGTLTKGEFEICDVYPQNNREEILRLAAICEQNNPHPIAKAILKEYPLSESGYTLTNIFGKGVRAEKEGEIILCGNSALFNEYGIQCETASEKTAVYVAKNNRYVGSIFLEDGIKSGVNEVIGQLNSENCTTLMLTGDNQAAAKSVASKVNITNYKHSLLPQDKVAETEKIIASKNKKDIVCFIGDGINDAPALIRADVGVAMGAIGSDAAIEAADVVFLQDDLKCLPLARKIAKTAVTISVQNIVFSIAVKVIIMLLSALNITNMWIAIFGDVGVAIIAILNAIRAIKIK